MQNAIEILMNKFKEEVKDYFTCFFSGGTVEQKAKAETYAEALHLLGVDKSVTNNVIVQAREQYKNA